MSADFGRGKRPIRVMKNRFTEEFDAAERAGRSEDELAAIFNSRTLKMAACDGDVEWGKVEVGQCAGLIDELVPAAELVQRLVAEFDAAAARLAGLRPEATR